jgi:hypothetical protein
VIYIVLSVIVAAGEIARYIIAKKFNPVNGASQREVKETDLVPA